MALVFRGYFFSASLFRYLLVRETRTRAGEFLTAIFC